MTKKEIAYENIRNDIFCQKLVPGAKLVISQLAEQYNMSSIPVREALTMLENDQLVTNIPYVGFVVSHINFDEYIEHSLMRNQLECLALRMGLTYLTSESLMEITSHQQKLRDLYNERQYEEYVIYNRKFYPSLYSFAPCDSLKNMIELLDRKTYLSPSILLLIPERISVSLNEHDALIEAITNGDADSAAQILFVHRLNTIIMLLGELKYNLIKPKYKEQHILHSFFSEEALEDRNNLIGMVDRWSFILQNLALGFTKSSINSISITDRYAPPLARNP